MCDLFVNSLELPNRISFGIRWDLYFFGGKMGCLPMQCSFW